MQKKQDTIQRASNGEPAIGVSVLVQSYPGAVTASLFSDDGVTALANPLTTDAYGSFSYYAANGRYQYVISGPSVVGTRTDTDILLYDPADADPTAVPFPIDDLTDVVLTTPAVGDLLTYDGTSWVNTPPVVPVTGTFTPIISGATTAGSGTYSAQDGTYSKTGNIVHFSLTIFWSAHSGTGAMRVSLPPFSVAGYRLFNVMIGGVPHGVDTNVFARATGTEIEILEQTTDGSGTGGGSVQMPSSYPSPPDTLIISGSYVTTD